MRAEELHNDPESNGSKTDADVLFCICADESMYIKDHCKGKIGKESVLHAREEESESLRM